VIFDELIDHPGEFRVAFDPAGEDDLSPPVWDGTTWNTPSGVQLLAEHVPDLAPGVTRGAVQVTLPNIACATCTLQLMQIMTDKPPFTGTDDFYTMCADLVLGTPPVCGNGVVEGVEACDDGNSIDGDGCSRSCTIEHARASSPPSAPPPTASGGCGTGGTGALGLVAAVVALGWRRRQGGVAPRAPTASR
jgi:cysteine-rich repeat protein